MKKRLGGRRWASEVGNENPAVERGIFVSIREKCVIVLVTTAILCVVFVGLITGIYKVNIDDNRVFTPDTLNYMIGTVIVLIIICLFSSILAVVCCLKNVAESRPVCA